jgi:hypothetical protein
VVHIIGVTLFAYWNGLPDSSFIWNINVFKRFQKVSLDEQIECVSLEELLVVFVPVPPLLSERHQQKAFLVKNYVANHCAPQLIECTNRQNYLY